MSAATKNRVVCAECGKTFINLAEHKWKTHTKLVVKWERDEEYDQIRPNLYVNGELQRWDGLTTEIDQAYFDIALDDKLVRPIRIRYDEKDGLIITSFKHDGFQMIPGSEKPIYKHNLVIANTRETAV